jgi:hypothetical protein
MHGNYVLNHYLNLQQHGLQKKTQLNILRHGTTVECTVKCINRGDVS